jgi:hypothetical protein
MLAVYVLALIASIQAIKSGRHLFWIAAFVATTGAWAIFRLADIHFGNRYVFFMAFFPQVMVADAASRAIECVWRKTPNWDQKRFARMGAGMYLAALIAAIIWAPTMRGEWRNVIRMPYFLWHSPADPEKSFYTKWEPVSAALKPGDVVMMPYYHHQGEPAMNLAAVTGARMVAVRFSLPVPDFSDRTASVDRFFSREASAATRLNELKLWHANKIVLFGPALELEPDIEQLAGEPIYRSASAIVYRVDR